MWQDLRFALRMIRKNAGLTAAIVVSVALGIGANTTIFSVVKAALLLDLAVREPEQLVSFHQSGGAARLSYLDYVDYRNEVREFQDVAAFFPIVPASFGRGGEPQRLWGQLVTTNYFSVLGAEPYLGRGFMSDENSSRVVVISDGLWKQNLGSDPAIVGKTVPLSGARYNVVGVAPPGFQGSVRGLRSDFWVPLGLYAQVIPLLAREGPLEQLRGYPWLFVDARLKPGVSKTEAQAAVRVVTQRLEETYRSKGVKRDVRLVQAGSLPLALGSVKLLLQVLMVVVGLVLLVACANVANLLLAHSAARQKEMGIRLSIGATRARLVRQLLVESIALSMLGGLLGLGLAVAGTSAARGFQRSLPIPAAVNLSVDSRVLLFTFALSAMTGVVFGLVPALKITKLELTSMLRMDISGFGAGRQFGLTHGLVVVQITLALVLLVGAGLFLRSLQSASSIPLGMTPANVLLMGFDPRATGYSNEKSIFFFRQLLERVRALPNVASAALVDTLPLSVLPHSVGVTRPEKPMLNADIYGATPRYFETMGIELVRGRDFDDRGQGALMTAVINETVARRLYGSEDPIGKTVLMEGSEREVIGVIRDTKSRTLGEESQPQIYLSLNSEYGLFWALFGVDLAVKTRGNPNDMIASVRRQIGDLEPAMAVYNIKTMRDHVDQAMLIPRICGSLFGIFGGCGLSLATLGLYGLMNYSVRRRTKELAIRMAIGATPGQVAGMVARQGLVLITVALAIGLALAYSTARILAGFLYGISAHDVATFVWVPALMAGVAVIAVIIPARRAAKVDVIQSIRYE